MSAVDQARADAAIDSYSDLKSSADRPNDPKRVILAGQQHIVFGYRTEPATGFHATAYQSTATGDVIIAYRGTDPDFRQHPRTAVLDVIADYVMARDPVNVQKQAAGAFTREMLIGAKKLRSRSSRVPAKK